MFTTGTVTSADGTSIGYRRVGSGPGLVLVHGAMQGAQSFTKLASELADAFTVHVIDRRGRATSGPPGERYGIEREVEDVRALLAETGSRNLFGLSSGALISMTVALRDPIVEKLALYEPPFPIGDPAAFSFAPRYEREIAAGKLAAAMVTWLKGTGDATWFMRVPRFVLEPLVHLGLAVDGRSSRVHDTPIATLIPTMRNDIALVRELEGRLPEYGAISARVLLLDGSLSNPFLHRALDAVQKVLPSAPRVTLPDVGHIAADDHEKPEVVAPVLRRFFQA
ncbi:Esterase/hydrolase [Minicystis rosea]|nr:Esterase/hydrolase [Minicystis rosea]